MRETLTLASVVVLTVVLAACGGDSISEPQMPAEPVDLNLVMADYAYTPSEVTVAPGAEVTITVQNDDVAKHDLVMVAGVFSELVDVKNAIKADPDIVVAEIDEVKGGESDSLVVTLDQPGEYQFFCSLVGHFVAGMKGVLTVDG